MRVKVKLSPSLTTKGLDFLGGGRPVPVSLICFDKSAHCTGEMLFAATQSSPWETSLRDLGNPLLLITHNIRKAGIYFSGSVFLILALHVKVFPSPRSAWLECRIDKVCSHVVEMSGLPKALDIIPHNPSQRIKVCSPHLGWAIPRPYYQVWPCSWK